MVDIQNQTLQQYVDENLPSTTEKGEIQAFPKKYYTGPKAVPKAVAGRQRNSVPSSQNDASADDSLEGSSEGSPDDCSDYNESIQLARRQRRRSSVKAERKARVSVLSLLQEVDKGLAPDKNGLLSIQKAAGIKVAAISSKSRRVQSSLADEDKDETSSEPEPKPKKQRSRNTREATHNLPQPTISSLDSSTTTTEQNPSPNLSIPAVPAPPSLGQRINRYSKAGAISKGSRKAGRPNRRGPCEGGEARSSAVGEWARWRDR